MSTPKTYTYTRGGVRITSARQLTVGQLNQAIVKAKAKPQQVAVFDQSGRLVGVCDKDKIVPLDTGSTPAPAAAPAVDDATTQAAEDVTKALQGARFATGPGSLVKSTGTVDARYDALTKSLDGPTVQRLSDAVGRAAMRFTFASGITGPAAVRLAKSIALDLARAEANRPSPSAEAALTGVRNVHARPRTVR
ncbi:MAG: hypothetical protein ACYC1E_18875 [Propionibacteriaceae bacterium]